MREHARTYTRMHLCDIVQTQVCLLVLLRVCLLDRLFARLCAYQVIACVIACLLACLHDWLRDCLLACLLDCLLASLIHCVPAGGARCPPGMRPLLCQGARRLRPCSLHRQGKSREGLCWQGMSRGKSEGSPRLQRSRALATPVPQYWTAARWPRRAGRSTRRVVRPLSCGAAGRQSRRCRSHWREDQREWNSLRGLSLEQR